jgi:glycosyltransferase involved in cell wall biosynthesis
MNNQKRHLISINPDLRDRFGHYLNYDLRLRATAQVLGFDFSTLANQAIDATAQDRFVLPTFSNNSWTAGRFRKPGVIDAFASELRESLERNPGGRDMQNHYFMYLGSISHAAAILQVAAATSDPANHYRINLFYSSDDFTPDGRIRQDILDEYRLVLDAMAVAGTDLGVSLCVDTSRMSELICQHTGYELPVLPFFSVTDLAESDAADVKGRRSRRDAKEFNVYYPGNVQIEKGYDLVLDLLERYSDAFPEYQVRFVLREMYVGKEVPAVARRLKRLGDRVTVIKGVMSDEQYKERFKQADVILLPYRRSAFFARTSAAYSDATLLGTPVVAVRGTWMGHNTQRLKNGAIFEENSVPEFFASLREVLENYDTYLKRAEDARKTWQQESNPRRVIDLLIGAESETNSCIPSARESYFRVFGQALIASRERTRLTDALERRTKADALTVSQRMRGRLRTIKDFLARVRHGTSR